MPRLLPPGRLVALPLRRASVMVAAVVAGVPALLLAQESPAANAALAAASESHAPAAAAVAAAVTPAPAAPATRPAEAARTEHVIVVSIDGLRPDAIAKYGATNLQRLMREGSYTLHAQTILPSKTLPSHVSMLTGVEPAVHGVTWNTDLTDRHGTLPVPTVFSIAKQGGQHTAAFFSKAKFHHLQAPGSLDYTQAPAKTWSPWDAQRTVGDAVRYLREAQPNLLFVHLGEPDYAGHMIGYMSWYYGANVRLADRALGQLVAAADREYGRDGYTLIVTSDHGGQGKGHGSDHELDTTIPWITRGRGVQAGGVLPTGVRTMDTAATALWLLGVPVPASWTGRAVEAAYQH